MIITPLAFYQKTNRGGWYNNQWLYRTYVDIDPNKVGNTGFPINNYPVYLDLSLLPSSFHTNVSATAAQDLRITLADGVTEVAREVVYYNSSTDKGEVYFKGLTLSGVNTTRFYIYYGNNSATEYGPTATFGRTNVWDSNIKAVYHMNNSGTQSNSVTVGSYTMSNFGSIGATATTPISGTAQDHGTSGTSKGFNVDARTPVNAFGITASSKQSISMWVNFRSFSSPNTQILLAKGWNNNTDASNTQFTFRMYTPGTASIAAQVIGTGDQVTYTHGWALNTWHHIVATINVTSGTAGTIEFYTDGVSRGTRATNFTTPSNNSSSLTVGNQVTRGTTQTIQTGNEARIISEEVRLYSTNVSVDWIKTEYNNISSPSTFYTIGGEEYVLWNITP